MDDAIARYRAATEANDMDVLRGTLDPDVELVSPVSGRMVFRGSEDVSVLATAVYGTLRAWRWHEALADGDLHVIIGDGRVGPFKLADAMVLELAQDGRIRRIRPYLRPWLGLTFLALALGPKLVRHPGMVRRALARA